MKLRPVAQSGGLVLLVAILTAAPTLALDPARAVTQYHRRSWSDQLPDPIVTCLVQTRDGYLWAGTLAGLVRLDGVRAEVFSSSTVPVSSPLAAVGPAEASAEASNRTARIAHRNIAAASPAANPCGRAEPAVYLTFD